MVKKQYPKSNNPKLSNQFSIVSDQLNILAVGEGRFGMPVKRSGRFINANYPPSDVSQEELERFWGDPNDIVPLRDMDIKPFKKSERKHKFEQSFL